MNPEEAKLILQCRRPNGRDDDDAVIREAMAVIREDAGAMEILRREGSVDAAIGGRLRSVDPPVDLLRNILVGAKIARPGHLLRRPAWLAAAAALIVSAVMVVIYWPANAPGFAAITLSDFRTATTQKLNAGPNIHPLSTFDDVKAHLAENSMAKFVPVPDNLCHCPGGTVGCEVFKWQGREVTLICFNAGKAGTVHLFTVDASALEDRPGGAIYQPSNGWQTRAWIKDGRLMVLAGSEKDVTREDLEGLVRDDG